MKIGIKIVFRDFLRSTCYLESEATHEDGSDVIDFLEGFIRIKTLSEYRFYPQEDIKIMYVGEKVWMSL